MTSGQENWHAKLVPSLFLLSVDSIPRAFAQVHRITKTCPITRRRCCCSNALKEKLRRRKDKEIPICTLNDSNAFGSSTASHRNVSKSAAMRSFALTDIDTGLSFVRIIDHDSHETEEVKQKQRIALHAPAAAAHCISAHNNMYNQLIVIPLLLANSNSRCVTLLLKYLPQQVVQTETEPDVCINLPTISDPFGCIIININIVIDTNRSTGQSCHDNYPIMMQSIMHQQQPWRAFSVLKKYHCARSCMKESDNELFSSVF